MKVFVVTSGCYSDYTIEKLFSNRPAAEEYCKWHGGEIEEFEVYDEPFTKEEGEHAVCIRIQGTVCPEAVVNIRFETRRNIIHSGTITHGVGVSYINRRFEGNFDIYAYRYVPAEFWDEEKWKAKMTKHLHDLAAMAKFMFAEGASVTMVEEALNKQDMEG